MLASNKFLYVSILSNSCIVMNGPEGELAREEYFAVPTIFVLVLVRCVYDLEMIILSLLLTSR